MSFPGSQCVLVSHWILFPDNICYNVFKENVYTIWICSDEHQDIWYGKTLRWHGPIANTGVWDGILTCANEERMGWCSELCQWGWRGSLTCVNEEDGMEPWPASMRRMGWYHDLCQRELGGSLNWVNENGVVPCALSCVTEENEVVSWTLSMRKGDDALTWISGTKHQQDIGELRKLYIVRANESVVQTEYIMCSLIHLQKSFLNKTWLSYSLFSWRHPYFSDVWGKGLLPGMSLNSSLSMCWDICRSSELNFW